MNMNCIQNMQFSRAVALALAGVLDAEVNADVSCP